MKFKQLSTGAVLEAMDEAVIDMMKASPAYAAIEQPKAKPDKPAKGDKGKPAEGDKPAEDSKPAE